jgi:hypothetical protein
LLKKLRRPNFLIFGRLFFRFPATSPPLQTPHTVKEFPAFRRTDAATQLKKKARFLSRAFVVF